MDDRELELEIANNKMWASFRNKGVTGLSIDFSGSGDDGQIDAIEYTKDSIDLTNCDRLLSRMDNSQVQWLDFTKEVFGKGADNLSIVLEDWAYEIASNYGHDWVNNDGGNGIIRVVIEDTKIQWETDFYINYMETEHHEEPKDTMEINFDQLMEKAKLDSQINPKSNLLADNQKESA